MFYEPPTRTYCKRNRPLPYYDPNIRTPRHWKFTQDHRTTRPPPGCRLAEAAKQLIIDRLGDKKQGPSCSKHR